MKSQYPFIFFIVVLGTLIGCQKTQNEDQSSTGSMAIETSGSNELVYDSLKSSHNLLGSWEVFSTDLNKTLFTIEIFNGDRKYNEVITFYNGEQNVHQLKRENNQYFVQGSSNGEYYLINQQNELTMYDHRGIIDEANGGLRVVKSSRRFIKEPEGIILK